MTRTPIAVPVAVVEPQMQGVFHAPFNAALLHSIALAWPETAVSFAAMPEHLHEVRSLLAEHAPGLPVEWRELPPLHGHSLPRRLLHNRRVLRAALADGERLLFSSISRMQLIQLQSMMRAGDRVRAVLHGDLEQLVHLRRERFPASLFSLQRALARPQPAGLRYVLLGESIRENIPAAFAAAFANAAVINHPYHFLPPTPRAGSPPVFGVFGNAGDGLILETVARTLQEVEPAVRIRLVGFAADEAAAARLRPLVGGVSVRPLSRAEFLAQAGGLTHALWLAPPESSRLRASGTFLDALSFATPLVFSANAFLDHYHALSPGIGIRCGNAAEVVLAMRHILRTETPETYAAAQQAMLRLRTRFTPQSVAASLRAALDWDE